MEDLEDNRGFWQETSGEDSEEAELDEAPNARKIAKTWRGSARTQKEEPEMNVDAKDQMTERTNQRTEVESGEGNPSGKGSMDVENHGKNGNEANGDEDESVGEHLNEILAALGLF
jgi:hypothetical protein